MTSEQQHPAGEVALAAEFIKGMSHQRAMPADELLALIDEGKIDPAELHRGFATLMQTFLAVLDEPTQVIAPVLRRMARTRLVPPDQLPTMAGSLAAAALGQPPPAWRDQFLPPVQGVEAYSFAMTTWLLSDLIDHFSGAGTTARMLDEALGKPRNGDG